eukprot:571430-Ditylum_brightwellii.AAC.1
MNGGSTAAVSQEGGDGSVDVPTSLPTSSSETTLTNTNEEEKKNQSEMEENKKEEQIQNGGNTIQPKKEK